ncbi:lasso peptide biosynthesis PqqD family chaperone [Streptomyces sp. NPDC054863]
MKIAINRNYRIADTEYGAIMLNEKQGTYWHLNPTAAAAVRSLIDGSTVEEASTRVAEKFDVAPEVARQDVLDLVSAMREAGAVS